MALTFKDRDDLKGRISRHGGIQEVLQKVGTIYAICGLLRSGFWAGRSDLIWDRLQCVKRTQGQMTTFYKTYFNKTLLNCQFHSSLIF
jgi:hypothetical protein